MNIKILSDKIVFNILKNIQFGYLELVNHDGEVYKFGDPNDTLKANIKIKNSNFTFNLIKGGSVGFAESYMKNDFETFKNIKSHYLMTAHIHYKDIDKKWEKSCNLVLILNLIIYTI